MQGPCLEEAGAPQAVSVSCLSLPCELWLGLLSRVQHQGRVQRLQELLSDVQSASGHVKTNSGGTLLTVSATFGGGGWSCRGDVAL